MEPDVNSSSPQAAQPQKPTAVGEDQHHYSALVKTILAVIAVIVVIAVFVGGYQGLRTVFGLGSSQQPGTPAPQGNLVVSVVTVSTTTGQTNGIVPVIVDASTGSAQYMPSDRMASGQAATLQYNVSSDASVATFLGTPFSTSTNAYRTPLVFRADLAGLSTYQQIVRALQTAAVAAAPTATDYFRESPVISPQQLILYSSISAQQFDNASSTFGTLPANAWSIYAVDANGNKTVLTQGLYPRWIDNNRFAFLKNDGVYLYDISNQQETKVLNLSFIPDLTTGFDVSDDGQFMAISHPEAGELTIMRALNWDSGLLSTYANLNITATSPTFSPDDSYLAMLSLSSDDSTGTVQTNAAIRYYSLLNQQFSTNTVTFNPDTTGGLYLTDWR